MLFNLELAKFGSEVGCHMSNVFAVVCIVIAKAWELLKYLIEMWLTNYIVNMAIYKFKLV